MDSQPKVHSTRVINRGADAVTSIQGFAALNDIVSAAHECITVHHVEKTKRAQIAAYETTEVARIKAAETVLLSYFEQVFAERRSNFAEMFSRLDVALEAQDGATVNAVLRGIVDIAKSSPLADMGDLSGIRAALDDPDHVFDL